MTLIKRALFGAVASLLAASSAQAATQVYSSAAPLAGNQAWTGTLGLNFQVNQAITVSAVHAFVGTAPLIDNLSVTFFDSLGNSASPVFNFVWVGTSGGPYQGMAVTPFTLAPGSYQLAAWGFNDTNKIYNAAFFSLPGAISFNTLGGALTPLLSSYSLPGTGGAFANLTDIGTAQYGSASFTATVNPVSAVPEPASWMLMIAGFGLVGVGLRRKAAIAA